MFLPRLMDYMMSGLRKPRNILDTNGNPFRREILPLLSSAAPFVLDDETARLCQSVGPKVVKHGEIFFKHFKPAFPIMWIEFNCDVVLQELERNGFEKEPSLFSPEISALLDRRVFGYLVDNRYDDGIMVQLYKDRGPIFQEPPVEVFFDKGENGLMTLSYTSYPTGVAPGASDEELNQDLGNLIMALDVIVSFNALLNAKKPIFEIEDAKRGFQARKIKDKAAKIGMPGRVALPDVKVIKLSELGKIHDQALDHAELDRTPEYLTGRSKRRSPRRHPVVGHTYVRNGAVHWKNPFFRGGGAITPTRVVSDIGNQELNEDAIKPEEDWDMGPS